MNKLAVINLLIMAPVTWQVFQFGSVFLLFFVRLYNTFNVWLLQQPQFHRGVAASSRIEISRDKKLSSQLEHTSKQSSSSLSFQCLPPLSLPLVRQTDEMWRDSPDKTSGPYLIWFWFKVRFKTSVRLSLKKKSDLATFSSRWDQTHICSHKSHLFWSGSEAGII